MGLFKKKKKEEKEEDEPANLQEEEGANADADEEEEVEADEYPPPPGEVPAAGAGALDDQDSEEAAEPEAAEPEAPQKKGWGWSRSKSTLPAFAVGDIIEVKQVVAGKDEWILARVEQVQGELLELAHLQLTSTGEDLGTLPGMPMEDCRKPKKSWFSKEKRPDPKAAAVALIEGMDPDRAPESTEESEYETDSEEEQDRPPKPPKTKLERVLEGAIKTASFLDRTVGPVYRRARVAVADAHEKALDAMPESIRERIQREEQVVSMVSGKFKEAGGHVIKTTTHKGRKVITAQVQHARHTAAVMSDREQLRAAIQSMPGMIERQMEHAADKLEQAGHAVGAELAVVSHEIQAGLEHERDVMRRLPGQELRLEDAITRRVDHVGHAMEEYVDELKHKAERAMEHGMEDMERHAKHFVKAPKAELKEIMNKPREVLSQYDTGLKVLKVVDQVEVLGRKTIYYGREFMHMNDGKHKLAQVRPVDLQAHSAQALFDARQRQDLHLFHGSPPGDDTEEALRHKYGKVDRSVAIQRYCEGVTRNLVRCPRLIEVVLNGNVDELARLLVSGADPNSRAPCIGLVGLETRNHLVHCKVSGCSSATALHACAAKPGKKSLQMAELLLENKADPGQLLSPNNDTVLHIAAYGRNVAMVELLVDRRAHLETMNHWGHTALSLAVVVGDEPVVQTLLDLGANVLHRVTTEDPMQKPLYPIEVANQKGHLRLAVNVLKRPHHIAINTPPPVVIPAPAGWTRTEIPDHEGVMQKYLFDTRGNYRREHQPYRSKKQDFSDIGDLLDE